MDHEQSKARFTCYHDGLLSRDKQKDLEAHLAECADCRAEWDAFKKTVSGLGGLSIASLPEEFARNVTQEIKRRSIRRFWTQQNVLGAKTALLAFMLIAFLVLIYLVYLFMLPDPTNKAKPHGAVSKDRGDLHIIGPVHTDISKEKEKKEPDPSSSDSSN